jgi:cytoskeletal protein RodZ
MENNKMTAIIILLLLMLAAFVIGWLISRLLNTENSDHDELADAITEREAQLEACRKQNVSLSEKAAAATAAASATANAIIAEPLKIVESIAPVEIPVVKSLVEEPAAIVAPLVAVPSVEVPAVTIVDSGRKDDLKIIEGIGPKIEELFHNAGILTFAQLASSSVDRLKEILQAAGPRYQMHDPTTWPTQSELASTGKWTELKTLQDELNKGKA